MSDVVSRRRAALQALIERHTLAGLARLIDKPVPQLSDMVHGRKSFGEKVARDIERRYAPDRAAGWLDEGIADALLPEEEATARLAAVAAEGTHERWPFSSIPFSAYEALSPTKKKRLEERVADFIAGAQEEHAAKRSA